MSEFELIQEEATPPTQERKENNLIFFVEKNSSPNVHSSVK